MSYLLIAVQYAAQNIAFFCCALFAGAAVYANLVEHPSRRLLSPDFHGESLRAGARRSQGLMLPLAAVGGGAGLVAGITGLGLWWTIGSTLLLAAIPLQIVETRRLVRASYDHERDPGAPGTAQTIEAWGRLNAASCLASLCALSAFILNA